MKKSKDESSLEKIIQSLKESKLIELESVSFIADELELFLKPKVPIIRRRELLETEFSPPVSTYPGRIAEVRLGATKSEGGTRDRSIIIGGEKVPAFCRFEGVTPHKPAVSFDIFDMKIPLPRAIRQHFEDVLEDPAEWAKRCVEKYGAEMVQIHLVSTDPSSKDTPPSEAAKTVEKVLQAVKVPIAVGGSGNPEKDPKVLEKAAEVAEEERILINSARLDTDFKRIGEATKKYGHAVIAFTALDMNLQRSLNRELMAVGVPKESILMDPTTAALGYGLEYSFSIMERIRLAGLLGDAELQMPLASGTSNTWAAREAWVDMPEWGPRELRGPLWETTTALALLLAGCDFFMMIHPEAIKIVKEVVGWLMSEERRKTEEIVDWTRARMN